VRRAWLRLDVEKGNREELARLTGIPATSLSAMNTGRRAMTPEMAARIAAAVPGLSVLELGAPEEEAGREEQSMLARLEALEAALGELAPLIGRVADLQEQLDDLSRRAGVHTPRAPHETGRADRP